jgi:hypothetical protein
MLENIVNGFEEMMNSIMAAFSESYNDKYADWNEGEETIAEALGSRPGLRQFLQGLMGVVSSYIFGFRAFVMFNLHWA